MPGAANTVDAITGKIAIRDGIARPHVQLADGDGRKRREQRKRGQLKKRLRRSNSSGRTIDLSPQPPAPEWMPYWDHLRKNLYLHSSN